MILFFYGADTYRLNQKIRVLKEKFISASLGDTNLAVLDGEKISSDEIVRQTLTMPFLSKSRLVIVNNIFSAKKEVIEKTTEFLLKVPKTTVLVIVHEGNPDKRTSLYKKLNKPGVSEEFKLLELDQLRRWVLREVENRKPASPSQGGSKIDSAAVSKLIEYVGSDLWRMENEIGKLTAYSQQLTAESIELLVQPQVESNIFSLMEAISRRNLERATKELYKLYSNGAAEHYILSMIVMEFRNLLIIKDLERETSNKWALAKKAGLHPFVAQKAIEVSRNYSFDELKKIYQLLSDFDARIKTGKIEIRVALELLIYRLTKN